MNDETAAGLDAITVPDFASPARHVFELRTLFFLGSWIDIGRKEHPCTVHLACIGEPPQSVRSVAEYAGASISVHEPLRHDNGGFTNKLRGLDIEPRHSHFLLLDTDIVFWSDPTPILDLKQCIAAAAAARPLVPADYWAQLLAIFGLPIPEERISCRFSEIGKPFAVEAGMESGDRMTPYYNSGVIYGPWSADLGPKWTRHCSAIAEFVNGRSGVPRVVGEQLDQVAFTTVGEELRTTMPICLLPDAYNVTRPVLGSGAISLSDTIIFHAVGLAREAKTRNSVLDAVCQYEKLVTGILRDRRRSQMCARLGSSNAAALRRIPREAAQFRRCIRRLTRRYAQGWFGNQEAAIT